METDELKEEMLRSEVELKDMKERTKQLLAKISPEEMASFVQHLTHTNFVKGYIAGMTVTIIVMVIAAVFL